MTSVSASTAEVSGDVLDKLATAAGALAGHPVAQDFAAVIKLDRARVKGAYVKDRTGFRL